MKNFYSKIIVNAYFVHFCAILRHFAQKSEKTALAKREGSGINDIG